MRHHCWSNVPSPGESLLKALQVLLKDLILLIVDKRERYHFIV